MNISEEVLRYVEGSGSGRVEVVALASLSMPDGIVGPCLLKNSRTLSKLGRVHEMKYMDLGVL